jgi:phospholipid transport system substrate-binding protein
MTTMKKFTKAFLLSAAACCFASPTVMAAPSVDVPVYGSSHTLITTAGAAQDSVAEGARKFIAGMGDRGLNFLGNPSMSPEAKKTEFRKLLNDSFDMNTIARFSLGTHWRSATPAQQKEYLRLFNDMIVKVYSRRFSEYKGQKFEVRSSRKEGEKDYVVSSFILPPDGPQVRVDWRVRNRGNSYKVVDIMVEGVSMAQTQRADFSSVIQRGGGKVEALLAHLRQQ